MKRIRTLATSCAPRTSEKDASRAAALTEHDPGLSPEKSAKSSLCTPCLDDAAALLCSRAPAGMREAARAAWVAIARRRCRVLPGGIGWVATRREPIEPGGGAAYLCAVRSTCREKTTTGAWPRERGGAVFTACACGRGAAGRGDKAIACAAATRSGGRYPMCGGLRARRHAVRRCCWLLSFLSANLFFFYCHFDLIDRDDARLLFFL